MKRSVAIAAAIAVAITAAVLLARRPAVLPGATAAQSIAGEPARDDGLPAPRQSARPATAGIERPSGRPGARSPRKRGATLAEISAELLPRAQGGDAAAASRLFRETWRCLSAAQMLAASRGVPGQLPDEKTLDAFERRKAELRRTRAECGEDEAVDDGRFYAIALRAADLGDETAACHYVNAPALVNDGRLARATPFDVVIGVGGESAQPPPPDDGIVAAYAANAERLAQRGIERGDWDMVNWFVLLFQGNGGGNDNPLARDDDAARYRYVRLWGLGEPDPEQRRIFEASLRENTDAAGRLSPDQIAAGDAWAQETYARYFSPRPATASAGIWPTCPSPPSDEPD